VEANMHILQRCNNMKIPVTKDKANRKGKAVDHGGVRDPSASRG